LRHRHSRVRDALLGVEPLEGFAYYANRFRDQLATLPDFDVSYLDESLVVTDRLREQSALKMSSEARDQQRQLLSLRNRLITLLVGKVAAARRAFRFVSGGRSSREQRQRAPQARRREAYEAEAVQEEVEPAGRA